MPPTLRDAAVPLLALLPSAAWLPHRLVRKPDGALDKPPCHGARTNAPSTWFTFEAASALLTGQNDVAGIGFAIVAGLVGLDFDHCRDPVTGTIDDEVMREVERLDSYTYVTPSQTGIRVVGLNSTITGGKSVRWLPGGHKIEIFIGPTNHYNTFTADTLPGYETPRDISDETLDYLTSLDAGKAAGGEVNGAQGEAVREAVSNPDPQRSTAAIVAALACIPNTGPANWDEWNRIGMAVWRSCGGRGEGLDAWMAWSARNPSNGGKDNCADRWQNYFNSPPTKLGFGTLYYEARRHKPLFVAPFDPMPNENEGGGDGTATGGDLPFEADKRARILTMRELDALPAPEWLVEGLIPEKSLVVPFGPPKAGKTFIVLSWCLHVAAGAPWFGMTVKQGAVVYIAGEGTGGLALRLRAMRQAYGISIDAPLFVIPRAVNFRLETEVTDLVALVRVTANGMVVAMVVIDTLARAMPGADENSAQEVGLVIAGCDLVRDELRCTVIPIHHSGKDVARGARGTSALRGAWDTALEITSAASGKRVTMTVVDQKEAEAGQRLVFRMDTIAVGIGRTSLVPILDDTADDTGDTPRREPTGQAKTALDTLRNLIAGPEGGILPPLSGLPTSDVRGAPHESWRRDFYDKMPGEPQPKRKLAFYRASQKLQQLGAIGVRDPWVWLT